MKWAAFVGVACGVEWKGLSIAEAGFLREVAQPARQLQDDLVKGCDKDSPSDTCAGACCGAAPCGVCEGCMESADGQCAPCHEGQAQLGGASCVQVCKTECWTPLPLPECEKAAPAAHCGHCCAGGPCDPCKECKEGDNAGLCGQCNAAQPDLGGGSCVSSCKACWEPVVELDPFSPEAHDGTRTDVAPRDEATGDKWCHDFNILKPLLQARGFSTEHATDCRLHLCALPNVFCTTRDDRWSMWLGEHFTGSVDTWEGLKYSLEWKAPGGFQGPWTVPAELGQLKAIFMFRAKVTGGTLPEGLHTMGDGGLIAMNMHGDSGKGFTGKAPAGFWNLPTRHLMMCCMPEFEVGLPEAEEFGMCDHIDDEIKFFDLPRATGTINGLTRCVNTKRVVLRMTSQLLTGNAFDVMYAARHAADFLVMDPNVCGSPDLSLDWDAWCRSPRYVSSEIPAREPNSILTLSMGYVADCHGVIPAGWQACGDITKTWMMEGAFDGDFPLDLKTWTNIERDDLRFGGHQPGFTGPFPEMPAQTRIVNWANNRFTGHIPVQWGDLPNITDIDISNNNVTVPPLPWAWQSQDKTVPSIQPALDDVWKFYLEPPVWDKFVSFKANDNPVGWHQNFFWQIIGRYPSLRRVEVRNTSMFGMAGEMFDHVIWTARYELVQGGSGEMDSMEVIDLSENNLLGIFAFGNEGKERCRYEICPTVLTYGRAEFRGAFFPSLRQLDVSNNPNLKVAGLVTYDIQDLNIKGTQLKAPVAENQQACDEYLQTPVMVNHQGIMEPVPVCLIRQSDYFTHISDTNAECAQVTPRTAAGRVNSMQFVPSAFNETFLCQCKAGYEYGADGLCQMCPVGTFRVEGAVDGCVACPQGSNTFGPGSKYLDACRCDRGLYMSNSLCQPCAQNTYNDQPGMVTSDACKACPDGKVTAEVGARNMTTDCVCPVGTFLADPANGVCRDCPKGSYCPTIGALQPTPCPATFSTEGSRKSTELDCVCDGQSIDVDGTRSMGYYDAKFQELARETNGTDLVSLRTSGQCKACPLGMVCRGGLDVMFRMHEYPLQFGSEMFVDLPVNDTTRLAIVSHCQGSTTLTHDGEEALNDACFKDYCATRVEDPLCLPTFPDLEVGYWSHPDEPLNVYKCQALIDLGVEDAFFSCPGGKPGRCSGGRTGLACGKCADGWFMDVSGQCNECGAASKAPTILVGLAALGVLPLCYYFINGKVTAETSTMMATGVAMGSLLTLVQSFSVLGQLVISWEEPLKSIWSFLGIFVFDPKFIQAGCAMGDVTVYIWRVMLPGFLVVWMAVYAVGTLVVHRMGVLPLRLVMEIPKVRNTMGQMFQAFYIAIAMSCILAFQCYESPNGVKNLQQHPYMICGEGDHGILVGFAILGLVAYIFGFGAFYITACVVIPRRSQKGLSAVAAYRFIFFRFRPEWWFWGAVFLARNLCLALASVVDPGNPYSSMIYLGVVSWSFLVAQCLCWPWRSDILNVLDTVILFSMGLIVFCSMPFVEIRDSVELKKTQDSLMVFMVLTFAAATCCVLGTVAYGLVKKVWETKNAATAKAKRQKADQMVLKAWQGILDGNAFTLPRQEFFVQNLTEYDRNAIVKLSKVVSLELAGSKTSGSHRVSMMGGSGPQTVKRQITVVEEPPADPTVCVASLVADTKPAAVGEF